MKNIFLICLVLAATTLVSAQTLVKKIELKIQGSGGANGASVVWHPVQKKYYAAIAGNVAFPLAVFDEKGRLLSDTSLKTNFDMRGMWYNSDAGKIQFNGYSEYGWAEYELDKKGIPIAVNTLREGFYQTGEQSAGTYNPTNKVIYFLDDYYASIENFNIADGTTNQYIQLFPGCKTYEESESYFDTTYFDYYFEEKMYDYNYTTIIYTGIPKSEIGLLNIVDRQIELYDLATGLWTKTLSIPSDAPVLETLNFAYTNGIYWFFDKNSRKWLGYK